jgi:hypothetical protein
MFTSAAHSMLAGEVKHILVLKCQHISPNYKINRETGSPANRIPSYHDLARAQHVHCCC